MTAPGNNFIIALIGLSIILSGAYAIGRLQQWHNHGVRRDEAYQSGYDKASQAMYHMVEIARRRHDRSIDESPTAYLAHGILPKPFRGAQQRTVSLRRRSRERALSRNDNRYYCKPALGNVRAGAPDARAVSDRRHVR